MLDRRSLLALGTFVPGLARGQSVLPDKGLRIVVGFTTGGGADALARTVAPQLERRIGRRVVVENRPGNTGVAAPEFLKTAPTDGSAIAVMPSTTLALKTTTSSFPVDPLRDLAPITVAGTFQTALAVSPRTGVETFADYVDWLRAVGPERTRMGVTATDTLLQAYVMGMSREVGTKLEPVGYRGAAGLVNDLESGKLPAGLGGLTSFLEGHRGGRLRMLAVSGSRQLRVGRPVPTVSELQRPAMLEEEWYGFYCSSAVPPLIVAQWNRHLRTVLADREVAAKLTQLGLEIESSTQEVAAVRMANHLDKWQARLQTYGLKPTN